MSDMTAAGQDVRIETDSLGEVAVPAHVHWGAQTQRSIVNFPIGGEKMPPKSTFFTPKLRTGPVIRPLH